MKLENIIVRAKPARAGMTVSDIFLECVEHQVHALPFCDQGGRITGRVTLKNIMKMACLPEHMVELAHVLGDRLSCLEDAESKAKEVLCDPIEPYVLKPPMSISPAAPVIKALALMEKNDTSYVFVVDDGEYQGIVTIQGIAKRMAELEPCSMPSGQN